MSGEIFEYVEKIFECVGNCWNVWEIIWVCGKIFEWMGKYLDVWKKYLSVSENI